MAEAQVRRLEGKIALVTGGGSGIGAAIAVQFASEGATVAICGRRAAPLHRVAEEIHSQGGQVLAVPGDVVGDAGQIVETVIAELGGLDILINNAATSAGRSMEEMGLSEWRRVMAVNLDAAFNMTRLCLPHLISRRGNVLHISSISAVSGEFDDVAYAASKLGLEGFSRRLALEMAGHGVRTNIIRPGLILTEAFDGMPEEFFQSQIPLIPLGRIGQPEDIALAAAFLCSEQASFITGALLTIDGGESAE